MYVFLWIGLVLGLFFSAVTMAEVNLNTATQQELSQELKNIGEKKAAAIVKYRKMHGEFKSVEDLKKVQGIGESTFEMNRNMLSTNGGKKKK